MATLHGDDKVVADIERLERNFARRADDFPYELKTSIVRQIVSVRAIDTTAMIQAFDYHRDVVTDSGYRYKIDTSNNPAVFYDGFVEFPTANRDGSMRPGRYFVRDGIKRADIERVVNDIVTDSFVI